MKKVLLLSAVLIAFILAGCSLWEPPKPAPPQNLFTTLPMPAYGVEDAIVSVLSLGDYDEIELYSAQWELLFKQTSGGGPGEAEYERLALPNGRGTMTSFTFGTIAGQTYQVGKFSGNGELVNAVVRMSVEGTNILTLLTTPRYGIDKSALYLHYTGKNARELTFSGVSYNEIWGGTNETDALAVGISGFWSPESLGEEMDAYSQWGFWETAVTASAQKQMIAAALDKARVLANQTSADLIARDEDSVTELIGRQTAVTYYEKGTEIGKATYEYGNWLSGIVGPGGLSRIEWVIKGKTFELNILRNAFASPSYIYIFAEGTTVSDMLRRLPVENWPSLYSQLQEDTLPGVIAAIFVSGNVDELNVTMHYQQSTDSGSTTKSTTSRIGQKGGRLYMMFAPYSRERLYTAQQLLALLGKGGISGLKLSFPTIGTGLNYYLTTMALVVSDEPFTTPETSVSNLDLVGKVDLNWFRETFR